MNDSIWVYIKDKKEIDRRSCSTYQEADTYEAIQRKYRGNKWCDSWCTIDNAVLLKYSLMHL